MLLLLWVFLGCGLGGICRYGLSWLINAYWEKSFPLAILVINVSGSFLMGFLCTLILTRYSHYSQPLRAFLLIVFLGGFTTFSSFSIDTFTLWENGAGLSAILNIFLSVTGCISATWLGCLLAR